MSNIHRIGLQWMRGAGRSVLCGALLFGGAACSTTESGAEVFVPEPVRPAAPLKPRGKIVQVDHRYRYDYVDLEQVDSQAAYLQSQGLQGGGHSWEGIVYGLLALRSPETLRQIEFDADGDGIAIWSQEREPLEVVAHLVAQAKSDQSLLTSAIDAATRDNRME